MLAKLTPALIILVIGGWLETEQLAVDEQLVGKSTPVTIVSLGRIVPPDVAATSTREPLLNLSMVYRMMPTPEKDLSISTSNTLGAPERRIERLQTVPTSTSLTEDQIRLQQTIRADIARMKAAGIGTP